MSARRTYSTNPPVWENRLRRIAWRQGKNVIKVREQDIWMLQDTRTSSVEGEFYSLDALERALSSDDSEDDPAELNHRLTGVR